MLADFTLDSGNTAWMLTSAVIVLMMTVPALAFFYGGIGRSKSVLNMLMMNYVTAGTVGFVWLLWGYSESFGTGTDGIFQFFGNPFEYFGLNNLTDDVSLLGASGVPAFVAVGFQATFAVITVALITGAIADRIKFGSWIAFTVVWATIVYFPLAHMVWGGGFLSGNGPIASALSTPIDFAGGTVVHIDAGAAGLALALLLGKRKGWPKEPFRPHNLPFVMLGAALLWFGWFGFNAGSAFGANETAGLAWVNTTSATAAGIIGWLLTEKIRDGHATSLGAASGVVAGLVAITPAAGALNPVTSIVLGLVAGALSALAVGLKYRFGYDDSLDVVGVHLVSGLWGTVAIGFLATDTGLFFGGGAQQLVVQILIALVAIVFSAATTLVIGLILKATMGWRVSEDAEVGGIDLAVHGETAYESIQQGSVIKEVRA